MMTPECRLFEIEPSLLHCIMGYVANLPSDGMLLGDFKSDCLDRVSVSERDTTVNILKRAKIIFVARDGAHWNVYKSKPDYGRLARSHDNMIDEFIADAAVYVRSIRRAIDAQDGATDRGGAERVRKAARRLIAFTRRQIGRGVQFDRLRSELWLTFSHDVISRAAECDRGFGRDATLQEFNVENPEHRRRTRGVPLGKKIVDLATTAELRGISVPELRAAFNGAYSSLRLEEQIDELEVAGRVRSALMKVDEDARRERRVFTASVGLPHVREDGVGTWGAV